MSTAPKAPDHPPETTDGPAIDADGWRSDDPSPEALCSLIESGRRWLEKGADPEKSEKAKRVLARLAEHPAVLVPEVTDTLFAVHPPAMVDLVMRNTGWAPRHTPTLPTHVMEALGATPWEVWAEDAARAEFAAHRPTQLAMVLGIHLGEGGELDDALRAQLLELITAPRPPLSEDAEGAVTRVTGWTNRAAALCETCLQGLEVETDTLADLLAHTETHGLEAASHWIVRHPAAAPDLWEAACARRPTSDGLLWGLYLAGAADDASCRRPLLRQSRQSDDPRLAGEIALEVAPRTRRHPVFRTAIRLALTYDADRAAVLLQDAPDRVHRWLTAEDVAKILARATEPEARELAFRWLGRVSECPDDAPPATGVAGLH